MLIYILDADFKKIDLLRDYDFAQYTDYARDIGTFQINARVVERNLFLLDKTKQFYLLFDDRIVAEITNVSKDSDSQYEKTMIIVGKFVINVFNYRIIYGTFSYKGYSYEYIRDLIYSQTRDVNIKRKLNIDVYTGSESDEVELKEVCSVVDKQVTGGYLWDEIKEAADSDSLVFNLKPKGTELIASTENGIDSWMFSISCGVDRTKGNKKGNIPVVFSQSLSNIERTAYTIDSSLYKNVAYVAGEGEGEDRKWYEIDVSDPKQNIDESSNKGWKRKELWVDARDIQTVDSEGIEIPEEEYTNLIVERSKEKFKDNDLSEQYTSTIIAANKQYEYGKDYNKGDWVTVEDEELGIRVDAQVTSVTKSVQGDHEIVDVEFTYGKIRDRNKVINNAVAKVEQVLTDVKYLQNKFDEQNLLWEGKYYMTSNQTIKLSQKITQQKNGIILLFCRYDDGIAYDQQQSMHFVPKIFANNIKSGLISSTGVSFDLSSVWVNGRKYLYISDDEIKGNDLNDDTITIGNVELNNNKFILRRVYGV